MSFVLGFDVSIIKTGWALLNFEDGTLADSGCIVTDPGSNLYERLKTIALATEEVIESIDSDNLDVALEGGFSARSGEVTRKLAMAWIMVALTVYEITGIEPAIIPPTVAKKKATGKGNSKKELVTEAALERWGVSDSDIADACWVAECLRCDMKEFLNV